MTSDPPEQDLADDPHAGGPALLVSGIIACLLLCAGGGLVYEKYIRIVKTSNTASMRQFVFGLRLDEESVRAENGRYVSLSADLHELCPRGATLRSPVPWEPSCVQGKGVHELQYSLETTLRLKEPGRFSFSVALVAGQAREPLPSMPPQLPPLAAAPDDQWYVIYATQPHGDGKIDYVVASSYSKAITVVEDSN